MTNHSHLGDQFARLLAEELRVEMLRQRKSQRQLAGVLGVTEATVGRRIASDPPFNTTELALAAAWLGVSVSDLIVRAEAHAAHRDSQGVAS